MAVDERIRKTQYAQVSESTESLVEHRLIPLKSRLESHFYLTLTSCEGVNFLYYRQGGFYLPHRDSNIETDTRDRLKQRQVSIVIFLNGEAEETHPGCYGGGALVFYGLLKDQSSVNVGFPLRGETGLLIAFPSHLLHEVEPVIYGERYTIVSWFLE